jgi:CheY-like chemotaxis protein
MRDHTVARSRCGVAFRPDEYECDSDITISPSGNILLLVKRKKLAKGLSHRCLMQALYCSSVRVFFYFENRKRRSGTACDRSMRNVLIVDDHEPIRRGVRRLLSSDPEWSVCGEAGDGVQAIEQAKQLHPDLIIMDVSMPKMNGVEATKIIRRDVGKSRILMISQNDPARLPCLFLFSQPG